MKHSTIYTTLMAALLVATTSVSYGQTTQRIDYYAGSYYEGEVKDGKPHGKGTQYYENQKSYEGQWVNGKKEGRGTEYYKDEKRYQGEWKEGKKEGQGTKYYKGEKTYQGEWKDDREHGKGTSFYNGQKSYVGYWYNGREMGPATYYINGYKDFVGNYINGRREGNGTIYRYQGAHKGYVGNFYNDWENGYGVSYYKGTKTYEGHWHRSRYHGLGTSYNSYTGAKERYGLWKDGEPYEARKYTYSDGSSYIGDTNSSGEFHGFGAHITSRMVVVGDFTNGRAHGWNIIERRESDGTWSRYVGQTVNDKIEGEGILFHPEGCISSKEWKEGTINGKAALYDKNGLYYYGDVQELDRPHGQGAEFYPSGQLRYEGEWKEGKKEGKGTIYIENTNIRIEGTIANGQLVSGSLYEGGKLLYEGEYNNGLRHGKGKEYNYEQGKHYLLFDGTWENDRWANGTEYNHFGERLYTGSFKNNKYEGKGTSYLPLFKTKEYVGEWKDGKYDGQGTLYNGDGSVIYSGGWKSGKYEGRGTLYNRDGSVAYSGEWMGGAPYEPLTETTITYPDEQGGGRYEGYVRGGKRDFEGTLYDYFGRVEYQGGWKDDEFHGWGTAYDHAEGTRLEGDWQNGFACGYAREYRNNKLEYEGTMVLNRRTNIGTSYYTDADTDNAKQYSGHWYGGAHHGKGTSYNKWGETMQDGYFTINSGFVDGKMLISNGKHYHGTVLLGKPHGWGMMDEVDSNGTRHLTQRGLWMDGKFVEAETYSNGSTTLTGTINEQSQPHGFCSIYYENSGERFVGNYENGHLTGWGAAYFPSGRLMYYGKWDKTRPHGLGTRFDDEGNVVYFGSFDHGVYSGLGTEWYWTPELNICEMYEGHFVGGKREGKGRYFFAHGVLLYDGEWKAGLKNGQGTTYNAMGDKVFEGEWRDDEPYRGTRYEDGIPTKVIPAK